MAFDIKPPEQPISNFTRASQGVRAGRNSAFGDLFKGVAQAVDLGIQEADRNQKENIRRDIFDEVDAIQAEFGVADATEIQQDAETTARPVELDRAGSNLEVLQAAFERGALKESHYWARMNSMVRQLRARYPGYRPEIDTMVSSITGARPANALRSSLYREWASNSSGSVSNLDKLVSSAVTAGTLPVEYYDRLESDNPFTFPELQQRIAEKNRQVFDARAAQAQVALVAAEGNLSEEAVLDYTRTSFSQMANMVISDSLAAGGGYRGVQERLRTVSQDILAGRPVNQQELQQDRIAINQLAIEFESSLRQKAHEAFGEDPTQTIASSLSNAQLEDAIKTAMGPIKLLQSSFDADQPGGVAAVVAALDEARKNDTVNDLLRKYPIIPKLQALTETIGPSAVGALLATDSDAQTALTTAIRAIDIGATLDGTRTVSDGVADAMSVSAGAAVDYLNASVQSFINRLDNKDDIPLEVLQGTVQQMFSPEALEVFDTLDKESQVGYYKSITNPVITQKMLELRSMGDVESWNTYASFVTNSFQNLFMNQLEDLSQIGDPYNVGVQWDKTTSSFTMTHRVLGEPGLEYTRQLNTELNDIVRSIVPLIKDLNGNVEEELLIFLEGAGFRPSSPTSQGIVPDMISALNSVLVAPGGETRASVEEMLSQQVPTNAPAEMGPHTLQPPAPQTRPETGQGRTAQWDTQ